eukprot:TRINITY_DN39411_c0_g1_i1.p1 TRINITY_DN39411_c0_g1~~TRINITY_DN39411_c0_g1_i1.p1  ORF type:complete len:127 (-),score=45.79 TRINITY_DN39411_c0_g1_i1:46-426(-)
MESPEEKERKEEEQNATPQIEEPNEEKKTAEEKGTENENKNENSTEKTKSPQTLAGGHVENFKFLEDGTVLKKPGLDELQFYEDTVNPDSPYKEENEYLKTQNLIPKYYGKEDVEGKDWVKIERRC